MGFRCGLPVRLLVSCRAVRPWNGRPEALKYAANHQYPNAWEPDPGHLAGENTQRIGTEEVADADRRDCDWSKWEEIASGIKWREEGDA